ncbi:MAG: NADPH-dependent F420 reductase [Hydrogenophaga sp.]|jgi:predicted dinucleotide-binding enzyme|uniref:NADPH-dependent F420 reductase n=1 Tax=Hydrogenophaga sp. TaxID=1904254 RepID=UPI001E0A08B2|nr:NADPH-dependent F420 reductase [Hydrogenophaga sp.]MBW0170067.1 NADPH-dependent F420 reductase [Hydrogenophaga sp.]MBW0182475.1 NADPH-dependent F420 reductase [Hydrogenophaga sp.]
MNIAFIGHGQVGAPLADHLQRAGHHVTLAAKDPASASTVRALWRNPNLQVATPGTAVAGADVVFLATPFAANQAALSEVSDALRGKVLVDCTNPVGPAITHALGSAQSGTEAVQAAVPGARVVKAFSIYGFENFEDNAYPGHSVRPVMMLCGEDAQAKATVSTLAGELGWTPLDVGGLAQALHLEHMTLLWVRMVRVQGVSPHTVWGMLQR